MNLPCAFALLTVIMQCATPAVAAEAEQKAPATQTTRPADAIVLFDGKNMDAWRDLDGKRPARFHIVDGAFDLDKCNVITAKEFGDFRLYLEFMCPEEPPEITGQFHANSGVYFHDRYELQILGHRGDTLPDTHEVGAIYGIKRPDQVATKPDGQWQNFDCVFRAPRFDKAGNKISEARLTVHQNGKLIHDNVPIPKPTGGARGEEKPTGPVRLQDKNRPALFRNIWIVPLDASTEPATETK
jgi:hypothetical protein